MTLTMQSASGLSLGSTTETLSVSGHAPPPPAQARERIQRVEQVASSGYAIAGDTVSLDPAGLPTVAVLKEVTLYAGTDVVARAKRTLTQSTRGELVFEGDVPKGGPSLVLHAAQGPASAYPKVEVGHTYVDADTGVALDVEAAEPGRARITVSHPSDPAWEPASISAMAWGAGGPAAWALVGTSRTWSYGPEPLAKPRCVRRDSG